MSLERPVRLATMRVRGTRALHGAMLGWATGAALLLPVELAARRSLVPETWPLAFRWVAVALIALGITVFALRRVSPHEMAARLDRWNGLNDRFALAWEIARMAPEARTPAHELHLARHRESWRKVHVAAATPAELPAGIGLSVVLAAALLFVGAVREAPPAFAPWSAPPPVERPRRVTADTALERERLERLAARVEPLDDPFLDEVVRALSAALDDMELGNDPREILATLERIRDELAAAAPDERPDLAELYEALAEALAADSPLRTLQRRLAEGDLDAAGDELERMADVLASGTATPEEYRTFADAMDALARATKPHSADLARSLEASAEQARDAARAQEARDASPDAAEEPGPRAGDPNLLERDADAQRAAESAADAAREAGRTLRELSRDEAREDARREAQRRTDSIQESLQRRGGDRGGDPRADAMRDFLDRAAGARGAEGAGDEATGGRPEDGERGGSSEQTSRAGEAGGEGDGPARGQRGGTTRDAERGGSPGEREGSSGERAGSSGQGGGSSDERGGSTGERASSSGQRGGSSGERGGSSGEERSGGSGSDGAGAGAAAGAGGDAQGRRLQQLERDAQTGGPGGASGAGANAGGRGSGGGGGGDAWGEGHVPNRLLDATESLGATRTPTQVTGEDTGQGATRAEVIAAARDDGFATARYRRVYGEYAEAMEEVVEAESIPGGYRFYVRRYFEMIAPRGQAGGGR